MNGQKLRFVKQIFLTVSILITFNFEICKLHLQKYTSMCYLKTIKAMAVVFSTTDQTVWTFHVEPSHLNMQLISGAISASWDFSHHFAIAVSGWIHCKAQARHHMQQQFSRLPAKASWEATLQKDGRFFAWKTLSNFVLRHLL